jgi:hypothetical protein
VYLLTFKVRKEALFNYKISDLRMLPGERFITQVMALRRELNEIKPDLVRCSSGVNELYLATRFTGIPYVLHMPGTMFWLCNLIVYALIHKRVFNRISNSVIGHREFIPEKPRLSPLNRLKSEFKAVLEYFGMNMINIPKFIYESTVHLMSNLKTYEERTNKYVDASKNYINNTGTILDAGCGSGAFAKKLAKKGNTITALDIQKQPLIEIKEENDTKYAQMLATFLLERTQ